MSSTPIKSLSHQETLIMMQTLFEKPADPQLTKETTALMLIDFQYGTCHPDYGLGARAKERGIFEDTMWFWDRLKTTVIPNTQRLLATARRVGVEVIHVYVSTLTRDGRDSSLRNHRSVCMSSFKDSIDAEMLPEVGPIGDEIVLRKVTASPFTSSIADRVLRNLGIRNIIFTGVVTDGCVSSTVRGAAEHDYGRIVVEDAAAARARLLHEYGILSMGYNLSPIKSTDEVVDLLEAL